MQSSKVSELRSLNLRSIKLRRIAESKLRCFEFISFVVNNLKIIRNEVSKVRNFIIYTANIFWSKLLGLL